MSNNLRSNVIIRIVKRCRVISLYGLYVCINRNQRIVRGITRTRQDEPCRASKPGNDVDFVGITRTRQDEPCRASKPGNDGDFVGITRTRQDEPCRASKPGNDVDFVGITRTRQDEPCRASKPGNDGDYERILIPCRFNSNII